MTVDWNLLKNTTLSLAQVEVSINVIKVAIASVKQAIIGPYDPLDFITSWTCSVSFIKQLKLFFLQDIATRQFRYELTVHG